MSFNLKRLLRTVFEPRRGERVLVMVDTPHGTLPDSADWRARRQMAERWRMAFQSLGMKAYPLLEYPATGASNADLPRYGQMGGRRVALRTLLTRTDIAVAMTRYSATAPLFAVAAKRRMFRAASMPNVLPRMTRSALAADYAQVAARCEILRQHLQAADRAEILFDTGHRLQMDLRYRTAHADNGKCLRGSDHRVINLPSGEAFIVPYEGEKKGTPSQTRGAIPVRRGRELAVLRVTGNRIRSVQGRNAWADYLRQHFAADPARRNIAELGLGCNDRAIVTGNVLEDEKAGFHWAYGRSEHLGGTVSPRQFRSAATVVHHDIVYAKESPITVKQLDLVRSDGERVTVLRNGKYCVFGKAKT